VKIFVVRHAIAEEREDFHKGKMKSDDLRPLTEKGKKEFRKFSKTIHSCYPDVELFFVSPLTRALQTADILKKRYKKKFSVIDQLRPEEKPENLLKFLKVQKKENIMIVGHEPFLSRFVGTCTTGEPESIVKLKKGGLCVLEENKNHFVIKTLINPKN
jgi:phosphohistidine phosphatase